MVQASWNVFLLAEKMLLAVRVFLLLSRERKVSPDTCVAGVELTLVARFSVQLLVRRGATTPSPKNPGKKNSRRDDCCNSDDLKDVHGPQCW